MSTAVQADAVQIQGSRGLQKRQSKYSKNKNKTKLIKDHLHTTGQSEVLCPCQTGSVTMDHLICTRPPWHNWSVRSSVPLPDWQHDNGPSAACMPTYTTSPGISSGRYRLVGRKLFSSLEDLQCMAALVQRTGASSWDINRRPFNLFYKTFLADFHVNKPQTKGLPFFKTTTAWFF